LKLVQVVFRHGARTPLTDETYLWEGQEWNCCGKAYEAVPLRLLNVNGGPASTNDHDQKQMSTVLPGGCSKGELTKVGQLQALELGYWLRQQYIDSLGYLPASYSPGVLAARTTNFSRTRATLAGVLTGLYPGVADPIPVITSGDLDEILFADTKRCPHLKVLMAAAETMLKAKWSSSERASEIQQLQQQLSRMMSLPEEVWQRRWMITDVHDAWTSLEAHGKELPLGLTHDIKDKVNRLATEEISAFICPALVDDHGQAVLRLSMGRLLDTLLANMDNTLHQQQQWLQQQQQGNGSSSSTGSSVGRDSTHQQEQVGHLKFMMYSGHDSTIMPLLTALGVDFERWPPYISNLVFELWELQPPPLNPKSNMAPSTSSNGNQQQQHNSSSSSSNGPYVVRVLYNKQPVLLPGASEANPTLLEFTVFKEQLLAPFILSAEQHEQACRSSISHDTAHPVPEEIDSMELNLSGGASSAGQQPAPAQQQQQSKM
jgi:hypothetical protein